MGYLILKTLIIALLVVAISEVSKRSTFVGAVLASLPLTSILAFLAIYVDRKDVVEVRELSYGIFYMVVPSLAFFLIFPTLLKLGLRFYPSLFAACVATAILYAGYVKTLAHFKIQI